MSLPLLHKITQLTPTSTPQNWPTTKKATIMASLLLALFVGYSAPFCGQLNTETVTPNTAEKYLDTRYAAYWLGFVINGAQICVAS